MYRRRLTPALTHGEVRKLDEAARFAEKNGRPLSTAITIHLAHLSRPPADVGRWTSDFLNKLRIWCDRAGFGYSAIWTRENYDTPDREHIHILLYVPPRKTTMEALELALTRWLPGSTTVFKITKAKFQTRRHGRRTNAALTYMLKQMTTQAWFSLGKTVRRESHCRYTGATVAPVLGKRCGISRSLNAAAQAAFWRTTTSSTMEASPRTGTEKAA